jgi:acetylornithine deacetylase
VNPCGKDLTGPIYFETEIGQYVEDFLRRAGVDVERQQVFPGRDNIVGRVEGRDRWRHFLLESHMDTMPGDNMDFDAFSPFVRDDRLHGRGACDTKGSLAAMLTAVKRVVAAERPPISITLLASVDEEYRFRGMAHFVANEPLGSPGNITEAIVGEPTGCQVVIAHKGCVRWVLRARGVAAHSANPGNGISAVYRMAKILNALERFNADELPSRHEAHPLLGRATLSVGTITGGQAVNIVPDTCDTQIDRRLLPGEEPARAMLEVETYLKDQPDLDFDFEMLPAFLWDRGMETPRDADIVHRFEKSCEAAMGHATVTGVPFGTNASKIACKGIPAVVFGPGDIKLAHTSREYVPLSEVRQAVEVLVGVLSQ